MEIVADLSEHNYCIAVPCYDGKLVTETCTSLLKTSLKLHDRGIKHSFLVIRGGALIHLVRNELVHRFLHHAPLCDTMICIDSDIQWEWEAFERLIVHSHTYPIVAGVYPCREDPPKFFVNRIDENDDLNEHGLINSKGTGMGFVAIQRKVFDIIPAPEYDNAHYPEFPMKAYFQCGLVGRQTLGEDIWFFEEAYKAGIPTMLDPGINLIHHGFKAYDYKIQDHIT